MVWNDTQSVSYWQVQTVQWLNLNTTTIFTTSSALIFRRLNSVDLDVLFCKIVKYSEYHWCRNVCFKEVDIRKRPKLDYWSLCSTDCNCFSVFGPRWRCSLRFLFLYFIKMWWCVYNGDAGNNMGNIIFFQSVTRGDQRPEAS